MTGQEYIQRQIDLVKQQIKGSRVKLIVTDVVTKHQYDFYENELQTLESIEKSLNALEILKKLFNPEKYNFLELYENPFITIGVKGEKYRIDSTDDSYIHIGIPKDEFDLLKEVLEC